MAIVPLEREAPAAASASDVLAPDCRGENFFRIDASLRQLLPLYLDASTLARLDPHFDRLGALAGGRLDELAATADKHPPVLRARDRQGRDEDFIGYHAAYPHIAATPLR